jgi:hypothetical protein
MSVKKIVFHHWNIQQKAKIWYRSSVNKVAWYFYQVSWKLTMSKVQYFCYRHIVPHSSLKLGYAYIFMFLFCFEDYSLLEYSALYSRWSRPTFHRCVLPQSSGRWWLQFATLKRPSNQTRLHGAISLKALIFMSAVVRTWSLTCFVFREWPWGSKQAFTSSEAVRCSSANWVTCLITSHSILLHHQHKSIQHFGGTTSYEPAHTSV